MNTVLISIASFIVAISVIVTIHELGHYLAARLLGVRVLRFFGWLWQTTTALCVTP